MAKSTEEIKEDLAALAFEQPPFTQQDLLSTGSTILNLALTNSKNGGFIKGTYSLVIGASGSGKTFLCLTCFAEAMRNPNFANYRIIFDNAEHGALMDIEKFFGKAVKERCEPPAVRDGAPRYSEVIEDFTYNVFDAIDDGRPFIYVLDSIDALSSKDEGKKFEAKRKARWKSKSEQAKIAGDYGDGKAKHLSRHLRRIMAGLRDRKSILIIINQERDNIDAGLFESKKTHSGGRALKFYAASQLWADMGKAIQKEVRGKKMKVGIQSRVRVPKNRADGKDRTVSFPILYDYGIDDLRACVDWLVEYKGWETKPKTAIINTGDDFPNPKPPKNAPKGAWSNAKALIKHIEDEGAEEELRMVVQREWIKLERELQEERKKRY